MRHRTDDMIAVNTNHGWRKPILNRPEKLNTVNPAMLTDLLEWISAAEADTQTGRG